MKWFRMYHEARTDAKLQSLTDEQFRVWFNLLCFANEQPTRGQIIVKNQRLLSVEIAKSNVDLLQETLSVLIELEVISCTDNIIQFVHWDKRQFKTDGATERWHKWKQSKETNVGQTLNKQPANVEQTIDQHVTDPDTDTDTKKDLKEKKKEVDRILGMFFPFGISPKSRYDINEYMNKVEDLELLEVAYSIADKSKASRKDSYLASVLQGFLNNGIRTIAQYEALEAEKQIASGGDSHGFDKGTTKSNRGNGQKESITGNVVGWVPPRL